MYYSYDEYISDRIKLIENEILKEFGLGMRLHYNMRENYFIAMKDSTTVFKVFITRSVVNFMDLTQIKDFVIVKRVYFDVDNDRLLAIFEKCLFREDLG